MRLGHYILKDRKPVELPLMEWAEWMDTHTDELQVALDVRGDVTVSTVFLGLDYRFIGEGPPILFETMVFGGEHDLDQWRYETWDQAVAGHNAMVQKVWILDAEIIGG